MAVPTITGQYLIDLANDLLGGYQNSVDQRALMSYLNEGKDEIFLLIKELHEEYFQVFSQSTNPSADYYFPQLSTTTREYTLPEDCRSIEFIECTTPSNQGVTFTYAKLNSSAFRAARMYSNELGGPEPNNDCNEYIYSIAGQDQFVMASYPSSNLNITLWYTAAQPDFEMSDTVTQILFPFAKKISEYAAQRAMLSAQDSGQFAMWKATWRDSIVNMVQGAGERNDANATFVDDFTGDN